MNQIVIYGAGGFAREVAWLVESCGQSASGHEVVCFADDDETLHGHIINDTPVLSLPEARRQFPLAKVVGAIASPKARQSTMAKAAAVGFEYATLIHPRTEYSRFVEVGHGTIICAGNILTTNITLGRHIHINPGCTIGHDVIIGDYTTLTPGVHIAGSVHLGRRVFVGTGATIINGTRDQPLLIGDDAIIGAGACVIRSVPNKVTVVGVPAKPIGKNLRNLRNL